MIKEHPPILEPHPSLTKNAIRFWRSEQLLLYSRQPSTTNLSTFHLYQRGNEAETLFPFHPLPTHSIAAAKSNSKISAILSFDEFSIKRTCEYFMIFALHSRARSSNKGEKKRNGGPAKKNSWWSAKTLSFALEKGKPIVWWVVGRTISGAVTVPQFVLCFGPEALEEEVDVEGAEVDATPSANEWVSGAKRSKVSFGMFYVLYIKYYSLAQLGCGGIKIRACLFCALAELGN